MIKMNSKIKEFFCRPYRRTEIDKVFTKVKASMHQKAFERGNGAAYYTDIYTGKVLRGGDPYDYEHIRSSEELYMRYCDRLTDQEIALVVNCSENVGVTMRTINQSKGKTPIETWLANPLNIARHDINVKLALQHTKLADLGIARTVKEILASR